MKYFVFLGVCAVLIFPMTPVAAAPVLPGIVAMPAAVQPCTPAPVEPEPVKPPAPITYPDSIRITEIFPDPEGDESADEFIELYNEGSVTVDLAGWKLSDATARMYTLAVEDFSRTLVAPGEYFVVSRRASGVALNNAGGDQVELYGPDDVLLDVVAYPSAQAAQTWAVDDIGDWQWTTEATPGTDNKFPDPADDEGGEVDEPGGGADTPDDGADSGDGSDTPITVEPTDADVVLSEVLADPEGSDTTGEWIELWNRGDKDAELQGWQLSDGSRTYTFADSLVLGGDEYYLVMRPESGISLNNGGDVVVLLGVGGVEKDRAEYGAAAVGATWARFGDAWEWAGEATPGEENARAVAGGEADEGFGAAGTGAAAGGSAAAGEDGDEVGFGAGVTAIAQARTLEKGAAVLVQGQVTALPGVFDGAYMYIADGSGGIQIYFSKMQWPELEEGWVVEVRGKISEAHGEKKLNVAVAEDVEVVETGVDAVMPVDVTAIDEAREGQLVQVQGKVSGKTRTKFVVERVVVAVKKATGISLTAVNEGESRAVVGIVTQQKDEYQLWPRTQADVQAGGEEGAGVGAAAGSGVEGAAGAGIFGGSQEGYHFFGAGSGDGAGQSAAQVANFMRAHALVVGAGLAGLVVVGGSVYFLERRYHFLAKYFRPKAA